GGTCAVEPGGLDVVGLQAPYGSAGVPTRRDKNWNGLSRYLTAREATSRPVGVSEPGTTSLRSGHRRARRGRLDRYRLAPRRPPYTTLTCRRGPRDVYTAEWATPRSKVQRPAASFEGRNATSFYPTTWPSAGVFSRTLGCAARARARRRSQLVPLMRL